MCFTGVCVHGCKCMIDLACYVGPRGCWLMLEVHDDRYNRLCGRCENDKGVRMIKGEGV